MAIKKGRVLPALAHRMVFAMSRIYCLVVVTSLLVCARADAQFIERSHLPDSAVMSGTAAPAAQLSTKRDSTATLEVALQTRGRETKGQRVGRFAMIGALVGTIAGGVAGYVVFGAGCNDCFFVGAAVAGTAVVGLLAGSVTGAILGAATYQ